MLNTIEEAVEDIKKGKVIIVVDDEDRENEGDFVTAARNATPEVINFMATHGRGLICAPLTESKCEELGLELMVSSNTALHETPFTISIDLIGKGCTTGISASDRSKTVLSLIDPETKASDLARPGHIFPLKAREGGVLRRTGHTEAAIDLARMAGFEPAGAIVEIMNEDGTMARLPELKEIAKKFDLKIISIEDLVAYRMETESLIRKEIETPLKTEWGEFKLVGYKQVTTGDEHLALIKGDINTDEPTLIRVHSSNTLAEIFSSIMHTKGSPLHYALRLIEKENNGVVLCMRQEGRDDGIINRLRQIKQRQEINPDETLDLSLGFKTDNRDYGVGAQILRDLGISKMKLITNKKQSRTGLIGYGLEIVDSIPILLEMDKIEA